MLCATTSVIRGREVDAHLGVVFGDAVFGVNVFEDVLGSIRDVIGGRSGTPERERANARDTAMTAPTAQAQALGADAILGIAVRLRPGTPAGPWTHAGS